jgi:hypothetical protein
MINTKRTPEELELQLKEDLLKARQESITELELELSTLTGDLRSFEIEYYLKVGTKYAQIDRLQATLDKMLLSKAPTSMIFQKKAQESQTKADKSFSSQEEYSNKQKENPKKFEATPELKSLYRELAKLLHPDLVLDPIEKERRHLLMQQINEAYQTNDIEKLIQIYNEEKNNPDLIKGEDIGSSLVRVIRKISQIDSRIAQIEEELKVIQESDLYKLFNTIQNEKIKGTDLLEKLQVDLESQIVFIQNQIKNLKE